MNENPVPWQPNLLFDPIKGALAQIAAKAPALLGA